MGSTYRADWLFLCLPAAVALSACESIAAQPSSARAEIQAVINEGLEATKTGDTAKFLARMPPDFVVERPDGTTSTKAQLAERLAGRMQNPPKTISLTVDITDFELNGNEARVMTNQRWERMVNRPGEAQPRHVVTTQRHEELWRKRNGRWEGYRVKELGGDVFVNGVKQDPTQPAAAAAPSAPAPSAPAAGATSEVAAVLALQRAWLDAYEQNDAAAMAPMLAEDFIITFPSGEMKGKSRVLQEVAQGASSGTRMRHITQNEETRVFGDTIVITGEVLSSVVGDSRPPAAMRYTDTYVKMGGRWQVAASHLTHVRVKAKP